MTHNTSFPAGLGGEEAGKPVRGLEEQPQLNLLISDFFLKPSFPGQRRGKKPRGRSQ